MGANTSIEKTEIASYTLLDDNYNPQVGYCLKVTQWASANRNEGYVTYVDAEGNKDELKFTFDHEKLVFTTHHIRAPKHKFDITPVIQGNEIVELQMDLGSDDVGRFVLPPEDFVAWYEKELITFCDFETVAF